LEVGTLALYVSLALGSGSIGFSLLHLYVKDDYYRRWARILVWSCCLSVTFAFLVLTYYFLASNLNIEYVHSYTDSRYDLFYKWGGVLAGADGTILFWVWLVIISLAVEELLQWKKKQVLIRDKSYKGSETEIHDWTRLICMIIVVSIIYLTLAIDLFRPTNPLALTSYPYGYGLHANLKTPLMIAHPPVEFAGYAFTTIPLAAALAFLITGNMKWSSVSLQWGRWAWLFYGLGIGIGGLWAYIVLGWGGYWAWDPIETVNLIPWLTLTAFVHAQLYHKEKGQYKYLAPFLAIVTFVLSLFATFVTRSGLWVSVHDFAEVDVKEPGLRLIRIMETYYGPQFFFMMILATLLLGAILFMWRIIRIYYEKSLAKGKRGIPIVPSMYMGFLLILLVYVVANVISFTSTVVDLASIIGFGNGTLGLALMVGTLVTVPIGWILLSCEERSVQEEEFKATDIISNKNLMIATIIILSIGAVVATILILLGVNGIQREVFDARAPWIVAPLIIVLVVCMVWRYIGKENSLYLIGGLVLLGAGGFFLLPDNRIVGLGLPILAVALVASTYKMIKVTEYRRKTVRRLRAAGAMLMLSGIAGMYMWGAPPSRISLLFLHFEPNLAMAVFGFTASSITLIGGVCAMRRSGFQFVLLSAILGILSLGYLIGAALSATAIPLIISQRSEFFLGQKERKALPALNPILRPVGAHLVHLGIVIFLIGYVLSTYLAVDTSFNPSIQQQFLEFNRGEVLQFDGYEFRLVGSKGQNLDGFSGYEIVEADIEISKEGGVLSLARPYMKWEEHMGHYHQFVYVENVVLKDIYFIVRGFYTAADGWIESMGGGGAQGVKFSSDDVSIVAIELKSIPGMTAVWSGFWIMSMGIVFVICAGYFPRRDAGREVPRGRLVATQKDYEKILEKELLSMEGVLP